jgi:hypothetical protein
MKKCREVTAETTLCGKDICCYFCADRANCKYACGEEENPCSSCYDDEAPTEGLAPLDAFKVTTGNAIKKIADLELAKKNIENDESALREQLLQAMEKYGVKKFETDAVTFTYVAPTTRNTIDSKALKAEQPDIAALYTKTSNVKASVKITVKDGGKK